MNPAAFSQHAEAASQRLTQTRLALLRQMALDGGASHGSQAFRAPGWPASEANEHPDLWQELRQTASA